MLSFSPWLLLQGEFKSKADQAVQAGEQFCELYYDILDTKRHVSLSFSQTIQG